MTLIEKKFCYIATYNLPPDSILERLYIQNFQCNNERTINIFENDSYILLAKIDVEGKINSIICKFDYEEGVNTEDLQLKATEEIIKSLNRLQIIFIGLQAHNQEYDTLKKELPICINILDYETGISLPVIKCVISLTMNMYCHFCSYVDLSNIQEVLRVKKDNIDEYIDRFLNLENLSNDPVLHFMTLYSLYEYINKTSNDSLKILFKEKNLEKEFRNTRNFAAHGKVEGEELKKVLGKFLGKSPTGFYSFSRYDLAHINLINTMIKEVQPIIQNYLKHLFCQEF